MKKNQNHLVFLVFVLALSLSYVLLFHFKLKAIAQEQYDTRYYFTYRAGAFPAFYLAGGAITGMLVQWWAEKPIGKRVRIACMILSGGLLAMYAAMLLAIVVLEASRMLGHPLFAVLVSHPVLFALSGLIGSVGVGKDE